MSNFKRRPKNPRSMPEDSSWKKGGKKLRFSDLIKCFFWSISFFLHKTGMNTNEGFFFSFFNSTFCPFCVFRLKLQKRSSSYLYMDKTSPPSSLQPSPTPYLSFFLSVFPSFFLPEATTYLLYSNLCSKNMLEMILLYNHQTTIKVQMMNCIKQI